CGISTGCGVVYKLSPDGKETVLHRFTGAADGSFPYAALILDKAGNLYGTADMGGDITKCYNEGCGTVYKVGPHGRFATLYEFTAATQGYDGCNPYAALFRDQQGNLYGTTGLCFLGYGTVFKVDPQGSWTALHHFTGGLGDGCYAYGSLVRDR